MARKHLFDSWNESEIRKIEEPSDTDMPIKTGVVNALFKVKVRSSPVIDYHDKNFVGFVPDGARLDVLGEENRFYRIRFGPIEGYCDKRFITIDE